MRRGGVQRRRNESRRRAQPCAFKGLLGMRELHTLIMRLSPPPLIWSANREKSLGSGAKAKTLAYTFSRAHMPIYRDLSCIYIYIYICTRAASKPYMFVYAAAYVRGDSKGSLTKICVCVGKCVRVCVSISKRVSSSVLSPPSTLALRKD